MIFEGNHLVLSRVSWTWSESSPATGPESFRKGGDRGPYPVHANSELAALHSGDACAGSSFKCRGPPREHAPGPKEIISGFPSITLACFGGAAPQLRGPPLAGSRAEWWP